jgi:hypothetical protein
MTSIPLILHDQGNFPPTHQPHSILSYPSRTLYFGTKFEPSRSLYFGTEGVYFIVIMQNHLGCLTPFKHHLNGLNVEQWVTYCLLNV